MHSTGIITWTSCYTAPSPSVSEEHSLIHLCCDLKAAELVSLSPRCSSLSQPGAPRTSHYNPTALLLHTGCPTILHTRKLNFALSDGGGANVLLSSSFKSGAAGNLLQMEGGGWEAVSRSDWTTNEHTGRVWASTGRTHLWLTAFTLWWSTCKLQSLLAELVYREQRGVITPAVIISLNYTFCCGESSESG